MFRKNVKNLSDVLNLCMRQNGLETPLLQKRLIDAWDSVMGPGVAAYTGDKFIKNQTLFVKITNPALRNDLAMMKNTIVRNMNNAVGTMVIADVRIY